MLLRKDDRGVVAIGQPAHAWLAGQLARAWGNEQFGFVDPREDVCLAAEQHDIGWAERDLDSVFNPSSGLPEAFTEVSLDSHLGLFTDGPRRLISQSRYVALLVSMHGWRLYQRRDRDERPAEQGDAIDRFLSAQRAFQAELIASLRADPATAGHVDDSRLERNSLLIWTWDYLSLALCLAWAPATAKRAPTADGQADLQLTTDDPHGVHHLEPWPFAGPALTVSCEGRRLTGRFDNEKELREAFRQAPWETLEFRLEPA
jgi:hypothetical protein